MVIGIRRIITFIELSIGLLLPWRLRCKYSKLLLRLEFGKRYDFIGNKETRDFDMYFYLGKTYLEEGEVELAIKNLNEALRISPSNNKTRDIHFLLAHCYKTKGKLDRYADEMVISYRDGKDNTHNQS